MPKLGAHMSIAGGLHNAFDPIIKIKGQALQIFTKNQRQWVSPALDKKEITLFRNRWEQWGNYPIAAHDSYLINLASPKEELCAKSINAFADEMERTHRLAIPYLVMHPGSHVGEGVESGLQHFVHNLDRAIMKAGEEAAVTILLETTAGQGTGLGATFEELAWILTESRFPDKLGVCFDTCHVFAAGYDIRSPEAYAETMASFDRIIGIEKLLFFHLNDSKKELSGRVDRHEHIGQGEIGLNGFKNLMNDPRFADHPMTLETPKGKELLADIENLRILRSLIV
jgi:deoxyribonuclease-4